MSAPVSNPFISCEELGSFFFERNLEVLEKRWPEQAASIRQADVREIVLIPNGGPNYRCRIGDTWIHGPDETSREIESLRKPVDRALASPDTDLLYLHGIGLGYLAGEIFRETAPSGDPHQIPIGLVLLEHRVELLKAMLLLNDWTPLLCSRRVFLCVGGDLLGQCRRIREQSLLDASLRPAHLPCRRLPPEEAQVYRQITLDIERSTRTYHTIRQREETQLRERHREPPRTIRKVWTWVGIRDRAVQYPIRGLMNALERKGVEIRILEVDPESYRPPRYNFMDLRSFDPDLVIQANLPSSLLFPPEFARNLPIPRVIWYLDNPQNFWHQRPGYFFTDHDHVFVWDESYKGFPKACGATNVEILSLATNPQSPVEPQEKFACTLSFVGQVIDQRHVWDRLLPDETGVMENLVRLYMQNPRADIRSLTAALSSQESALIQKITARFRLPLLYFLYGAANTKRRVALLEAVAQYGLKLYGPEAWLRVTREDSPLRKCFCGLIDYRTEFPILSRSSTINLNIRSLQSLRSLNMRDYDVPLQGGFLLSEWVDGADAFFLPDREMVFWRGIDDLKKKIEFYLEHPEERKQIIREGRERVLRDHTYDARAEQLIETLGIPIMGS